MENLWEKEKIGTGYVDIFPANPETDVTLRHNLESLRQSMHQKSNQKSDKLRRAGSQLRIKNKLYKAIEACTKSLLFAETGTECVGLAYAERARCFYLAKMFRECLKDISLARQAGVPNDITQKLQKAEQRCLVFVSLVEQLVDFTSVTDANEHFPGLGDMVDLKYSAEFGQHLVAKCDIPKGKVFLKGDAFVVSPFHDLSVCYTCLHELKNSIPCERCVYVLFCSRECMNKNQTHAYECGSFLLALRWAGDDNWRRQWIDMKLIIQTFFIALCSFSNVEELMEFVENTLCGYPDKLLTSMNDAVSKYCTFFHLRRFVDANAFSFARCAYLVTIQIPKIRALFNTPEKQCFLMHLILHHTFAIYGNSLEFRNGVVTSNLFRLMNHSCVPNAIIRKEMVVETTRPVEKGDQLFISYLSAENLQLDKTHRQYLLQSEYGINCKCIKCESEA